MRAAPGSGMRLGDRRRRERDIGHWVTPASQPSQVLLLARATRTARARAGETNCKCIGICSTSVAPSGAIRHEANVPSSIRATASREPQLPGQDSGSIRPPVGRGTRTDPRSNFVPTAGFLKAGRAPPFRAAPLQPVTSQCNRASLTGDWARAPASLTLPTPSPPAIWLGVAAWFTNIFIMIIVSGRAEWSVVGGPRHETDSHADPVSCIAGQGNAFSDSLRDAVAPGAALRQGVGHTIRHDVSVCNRRPIELPARQTVGGGEV